MATPAPMANPAAIGSLMPSYTPPVPVSAPPVPVPGQTVPQPYQPAPITIPTSPTLTPTPTGTFTAPDPSNFQQDPSYQFRLQQGQRALEHSAAAHGTLLSGATAKSLMDYGQGAASQEYGNAYNRALSSYTANRDTNAQNFGQLYNADQFNTGNAWRSAGAQQDNQQGQQNYNTDLANRTIDQGNVNAVAQHQTAQDQTAYNTDRANQYALQSSLDDYRRQVETARQNAATTANNGTWPQAPTLLPGRRQIGA